MEGRSATDMMKSLIHHVALPPQLPGRREARLDRIELALINRLLDATRTLCSVSDGDLYRHWDSTRRTLQVCKELNAGGKLSKSSLITEFRALSVGDVLILHVTEQNAGLLVRRTKESVICRLQSIKLLALYADQHVQHRDVVFEAFEASPVSEEVLAATSALQWDFPTFAVAILYPDFAQASFQDSLASFLEQASTESIKRFAAHSTKAGALAFESRDTVDPSLITQMLMTLLEVNGHRTHPLIIRKRVRDEVYWTDGAENPWRRSPYWLIVRVALQRSLIVLHGSPVGRAHYKFLCCVLLRNLIDEAPHDIDPDLYSFLQTKLARRLAKLEIERGRAPDNIRAVYDASFAALEAMLSKSLSKASERLGMTWNRFKQEIRRPIPLIPRRAWPIHTKLSLPNSEGYLRKVLSWHTYGGRESRSLPASQPPTNFDIALATTGPFTVFANRFFSLARLEKASTTNHGIELLSVTEHETRCVELASRIDKYIAVVGDAYNSNNEEMSIMLLTVMELWMAMDVSACALFSLLLDYSPGIPPESLDVLQLLFHEDMSRLKRVQEHLRKRYERSTSSFRTVFDDPARGCFAERYFTESPDSASLQELHQTIEVAARSAWRRKEEQWRILSADFEQLQRTILHSKCTYITKDNCRSQHDEHCHKCHLETKRDRMKIHVHEHPLPSDPVQAKAVVFELSCPEAFTAYRNTTWKILGVLAKSKQSQSFPPRLKLFEYSELKAYVQSTTEGICLASTAKSWLKTHYHGVPLPVDLDQICLPNGLKLGYYDTVTGAWPGRETYRPSFTHHCPIHIPSESPFASLQNLAEFAADSDGPSSYKVLAWQTLCPPQLNEHEFMAFQSLFSGKHRRWLSILVELGSSNLNFGTEASTMLISQLAVQAGPATAENGTLRLVHACFRDRQFCKRLMEQIDKRLHGISSNWREINCMEMLLTLILRLCSLATESTIAESYKLLERARATTLLWTSQLRSEIQSATTAENSRRCSQYVFRSALLCRRSFAMYAAKVHDPDVLPILGEAELQCFIECSIALQDNMPSEPANLPLYYKNMLARDVKMVYHLRHLLRRSLETHPSSLGNAIDRVWPQASGGAMRQFSNPKPVESSSGWWFTCSIFSTLQTKAQSIEYHLLEGHLMVDRQPLGKLPAVHRESFVIGQLFGSQNVSTYPSSLRGMTYTVVFAINGHQIHIGFRENALIVRACVKGTVLELIPRDTFGGARNFDLPGSLVEHCVHWLDLNTGILEIRQEPDIWISKPSNWILDFNSRTAHRRKSVLIDPHSPPFQRIARIFDRFEYPGRLTVFQPEKGNLSVELRRLELSFYVNVDGLLACRQLCAEIDPDQDAGTWYGLNSKLVLRDTANNRQRSIIVPLGSAKSLRHDVHVSVDVENIGQYGRYFINDVLGRLDCPPEPRLLYLKAQFHACTSFVIPDPLTGKTGSEEALHCLRSGYCQPWTPLTQRPLQTLMAICKLTPRRQYYPKDARRMQQVIWDPDLTPTIQHDELRSAVEDIYEKSRSLSLFATTKQPQTPLELEDLPRHLLRRSVFQRGLYHRSSNRCQDEHAVQDPQYAVRGCDRDSQRRRNVFESVSLLRSWPTSMYTTSDLSGILQNWPSIRGFDQIFDPALLTGFLNMQPAVEWGSMVNFCRHSKREDVHRLMFLFALISFGAQADMDSVRVWIAYAVIEDLKSAEPPIWEKYTNFRFNEVPTESYLVELIDKCRAPYPGDERDLLEVQISHKMFKKLQNAQHKHEQSTGQHCTALVQALLRQWPCAEPTEGGLIEPSMLDVPQAMNILCPEWLRLFQNLELSSYIEKVQCVLHDHQVAARFEVPIISITSQEISSAGSPDAGDPITLPELMRKPGPPTHSASLINESHHTMSPVVRKENIPLANTAGKISKPISPPVSPEACELERILDLHVNSRSVVRQRYGSDLKASLNALKANQTLNERQVDRGFPLNLDAAIVEARENIKQNFIKLCSAIREGDARARWLQYSFIWPCVTPVTLLEQLRSISDTVFGSGMKEGLIVYARSITYLQQLLRMDDAMRRSQSQRLHDEKQNIGHENWDPLEYQDWLLLEVDANILIRRDQVEVALASISPASGSNSVLQMNMGQGSFILRALLCQEDTDTGISS